MYSKRQLGGRTGEFRGDPRQEYLDTVIDPLTNCPDVRAFSVLIDRKMALARRTLNPLSLLALEVDRFASLGEHDGRAAIRHVAQVTRATLRESDTVCAVAPGVLAALLDHTSESGAVWAATRLRSQVDLRSSTTTGLAGVPVTASMGVASYPMHALDAGDLCDMAFAALHLAVEMGPSRIEVAEPAQRH